MDLNKQINLPVIGTVSLLTAGGIAIAVYFLVIRKKSKSVKLTF